MAHVFFLCIDQDKEMSVPGGRMQEGWKNTFLGEGEEP